MAKRSGAKKQEVAKNKSELMIGLIAAGIIAVVVGVIVFFAYASKPDVVHEPSTACDLVTQAEAEDLLGGRAINTSRNSPVIVGDTATSRCGYTNGDSNLGKMIVIAIMVRSGINDTGVQLNKDEFAESKKEHEIVKGIGDDAFYNNELGQLNILQGYDWMILSYGIGSAPEQNTVEDAVALAKKALNE